MKPVDKSDDEPKKPAEKPISLHPLGFKEALSGLLKVKSDKSEKAGTDKARDQ